jgi:acyl-CoA reductase-like NAD-dependent aldehyde dehydrogenase
MAKSAVAVRTTLTHCASTRRFIADPRPGDPVMVDEIFGPILPVLSVDTIDDAVQFVNDRPKPLGLSVFSSNAAAQESSTGYPPAAR